MIKIKTELVEIEKLRRNFTNPQKAKSLIRHIAFSANLFPPTTLVDHQHLNQN
jgi:hypothetical protein